jgi:hypothetical protein
MRAVLAIALLLTALLGCEREKRAIEEDLPASRIERARADARVIADAILLYSATFDGALPDSLTALTMQTTKDGTAAGPFLRSIPEPPLGWSAYRYERKRDGSFSVTSSSGDGLSVSAP